VAESNKQVVKNANVQPLSCPQTSSVNNTVDSLTAFGTSIISTVSEDCLFLNVYARPSAKNLPVLVWIHGGEYQTGSATSYPSVMMQTNGYNSISIIMRYRLGAFRFLSSEEVKSKCALTPASWTSTCFTMGAEVYRPFWRRCFEGNYCWGICGSWLRYEPRDSLWWRDITSTVLKRHHSEPLPSQMLRI
jgi:hypothetical protein